MSKRVRATEDEGDIYVAGTADVAEAIEFLKTWHNPNADWNGWQCEQHQSSDCACPTDANVNPEYARVRWYRSVPGCPNWCGLGHKAHWHDAEPKARGAFPAVVWWLI